MVSTEDLDPEEKRRREEEDKKREAARLAKDWGLGRPENVGKWLGKLGFWMCFFLWQMM
jgi:hypothetical protein